MKGITNKINKITLLYFLAIVLWTCNNEDPVESKFGSSTPGQSDNTWLISSNEVFDGGPGKDGIPSIDRPNFSEVNSIGYMKVDDLILGLKVGNEIRGYTHPVLDWHEIVNDQVKDHPIAITYCPLTGTGIGWNRKIGNLVITYGVSGLLYRNNLIPYDRQTNSQSHFSNTRRKLRS